MFFSFLSYLRQRVAASPLFSFNPVLRDRWVATSAAHVPAGSRVLDVGAGSCPYRPLFSHCTYLSQDFAALESEQLRFGGYGAIDYVCDAAAIPVPPASFDAVICTEVLEHILDPVAVVREFGRIVRPGGVALISVPLGSGIHQEPHHYYGGFTPYWLEHTLRNAGFTCIEITPNGGFFRYFGQESIRFLRLSFPSRLPFFQALLWWPVWVLLFPLLGVGFPLLGPWLDRFDTEHRFTVGFHVFAVRGQE